MKNVRLFLCALGVAVVLNVAAWAQPQQTPVPAPAPEASKPAAAPGVSLAPIAEQLGQTLQTLVGAPSTTPADASAPPVTPESEDAQAPIVDTFATTVLSTIASTIDSLKANSSGIAANAAAWPDFTDWLDRQQTDPRRATLWEQIGQDLGVIVGLPLLFGIAMMLFMMPIRLRLKRRQPRSLPSQVGLILSLLFLRLLPVFVFLGGSLLLLEQNETHRLPRFVILNVIYALSVGTTIQQLFRSLFSPTAPHLRFLKLATPHAVSAYRWLSAFALIIVYSYFLIDVATVVRVPASAITTFQTIFALVLTTMAIIVIFQSRLRVAAILRGNEAEPETPTFSYALRVWISRHWHSLATVYLIISLLVTTLGVENSFALMLRGTILSLVVLVAARFVFVAIENWKKTASPNGLVVHRQFFAFLLRPAIWVAAALAIGSVWGLKISAMMATPFGQRVTSAAISIGVTLLILTFIYELLNGAIERHLNRKDSATKTPVASARARTLLPMVRTSIFILFSAIALLMSLSAIGVNIAPLLAGAGVVGVAIGFGSQTLVKDFLTGLFIVAENSIAVGDVVKIESFSGVVEDLSIRTIRLRDFDGSLHVLPFSEVSKITNMTRGFAYAVVDVGVSYNSDINHVIKALQDIGASVQEDPIFKRVILEPIEVLGIDSLGASSINIRARMRTRPGKQWDVKRLLLLRIKQKFDEEKIEIPFPTVTQIVKH